MRRCRRLASGLASILLEASVKSRNATAEGFVQAHLDLPEWEKPMVAQAIRELIDKLWEGLGSEWLPTRGDLKKEERDAGAS